MFVPLLSDKQTKNHQSISDIRQCMQSPPLRRHFSSALMPVILFGYFLLVAKRLSVLHQCPVYDLYVYEFIYTHKYSYIYITLCKTCSIFLCCLFFFFFFAWITIKYLFLLCRSQYCCSGEIVSIRWGCLRMKGSQ